MRSVVIDAIGPWIPYGRMGISATVWATRIPELVLGPHPLGCHGPSRVPSTLPPSSFSDLFRIGRYHATMAATAA